MELKDGGFGDRRGLSRRQFLASVAASGLVACTRGRRPIAGQIIGGAHALGHRLRGPLPTPAATARDAATAVLILGGGIAGLTAAWRLERAGLTDYRVLELESEPGGTARAGYGPITPYPWGAHYVTTPNRDNRPMLKLLTEVGAVEGFDLVGRPIFREDVLCRDPSERIYFRGEWHEGLYPRIGASSDDLEQLRRFEAEMRRWAGWRDASGRRGFSLPRAGGSAADPPRALDAMSMAEYLTSQRLTSARLRWFVDYACRDDFGATLSQTSAWAGVHYFASRREHPDDDPAPFLTWPDGNGRLAHHLAEVVGSRLRLGALATTIREDSTGVDVGYLDAASNEVRTARADHGIVALPRFIVNRLLPTDNPTAEGPIESPWLVANLTLRERPFEPGFPMAWDNVIYDSTSLGYVVATHQHGRDDGPTVLTYYRPLLDDDPRRARRYLLERGWEAWVDDIVADLRRPHRDLIDLVERVDLYLWGHAMVRPAVGSMWSEALAAAGRPRGRLHFAHTDLSGMALFEEAQDWGVRAAEGVLAARGDRFESWLAG